MLLKNIITQLFWFIAAVQGERFVPDVENHPPEVDKELGYVPKTVFTWQHFAPSQDLSASVADFVSETGDCVRIIVFTGQKAPLDAFKVSCNSPNPFTGLGLVDKRLWYYGTTYVRRINRDYSSWDKNNFDNKFIVVKSNDNMQTCMKTWWVLFFNNYDVPAKLFGKSPNDSIKPKEDEDCEEVYTQKNFPLMVYSLDEDAVGMKMTGVEGTFNPEKEIGAVVTEHKNGVECFRSLVFLSYRRPLATVKVSCGRPQEVVATEKAFYYGKTVMVKALDDPDTFMVVFIVKNVKRRVPSSVCIKNMFKLDPIDTGYIKKKISSTAVFGEDPDCTELNNDFAIASQDKYKLLDLISEDKPDVGAESLKNLDGYTNLRRPQEINLLQEVGLIITSFAKNTDRVNLLVAVARGVVLDSVVVPVPVPVKDRVVVPPAVIIQTDELVYEKVLMVKSSNDMVTVIFYENDTACSKVTYQLETSNKEAHKKEVARKKVNLDDPDCRVLVKEPPKIQL